MVEQESLLEDPFDREYHHKNYLSLGVWRCAAGCLPDLSECPAEGSAPEFPVAGSGFEQIVGVVYGLKGETVPQDDSLWQTAAEMERRFRAGDLQARTLLPELDSSCSG